MRSVGACAQRDPLMDKRSELNERLTDLMRSAQDGGGSAYAQLLREITPLVRRVVRNRRRFLQAADIEDLVRRVAVFCTGCGATLRLAWRLSAGQARPARAPE